jgi:hypothetical protein
MRVRVLYLRLADFAAISAQLEDHIRIDNGKAGFIVCVNPGYRLLIPVEGVFKPADADAVFADY